MKKYILAAVAVMVVCGVFTAVRLTKPTLKSSLLKRPQVVTSFYPLYFFTTQIGGNLVDVQNLTPPGAEPHDYDPNAGDIAHIEQSQLLILNGGQLEAWGTKIASTLNPKQTHVLIAGDGETTQQFTEDGATVTDPHVWLSPPLASKEVTRIANALEQLDPANSTVYQSNATQLLQRLSNLDSTYRAGLQHCEQSTIVTSHSAFGYLATTYGLHQLPISGLSPDSEPSTRQLASITNFAKSNHVNYIFFESLVSPKLAQTIAEEVGAKTLVLDPIEGVSNDDMKAGKNYLTIMESNLQNLQLALSCK